jgi:4a-hydroxytetrahydrobiopterin dehydratase
MSDLHQQHCVPCEGGVQPLTASEIDSHIKKIKAWTIIENKKIEKKFLFTDFKHALTFTNEVGDVAEFEGHHPDIFIHDWNNVTIALSTHAIKGLSDNDFIMAAKIDQIIADTQEA